jgi:hypothetical protein
VTPWPYDGADLYPQDCVFAGGRGVGESGGLTRLGTVETVNGTPETGCYESPKVSASDPVGALLVRYRLVSSLNL